MKFDISKGQILSLSSNADVYKRGEAYFLEGRVSNVDVSLDSAIHTHTVSAQIRGDYMKYQIKVCITNTGIVKSYSCGCTVNSIWRGACKHVVALLFFISASPFQNFEYTKRAQATGKIISSFEKQSLNDADKELGDAFGQAANQRGIIKLEPELYLDRNKNILLRLCIGSDKMYVVKNIRELILNVRKESTSSYGKNLSVKHSLSAFDPLSQRLFEICDKKYSMALSFQEHYYRFSINSMFERDIPLSSSEFDEIADIFVDKYMFFSSNEAEKLKLLVTDEAPELGFDIKENQGSLTVFVNNRECNCIEGAKYGYLIDSNCIYRVSQDFAKTVRPFLDSLNAVNNNSIIFNNEDKRGFYAYVYPLLKKHELISGDVTLPSESDFMPEKKLYFDYDSKRVTCRVEFVYDGKAYNPIHEAHNRPENRIEEYKIIKMLDMLGFTPDKVKGLYILSKDELIYELYHGGLERVSKAAEILATDSFSGQKIIMGTKTKIGVRIAGNLLRMEVELGDYSLSELIDAVSSYNLKKKYHKLKDGRFINLEDEDISAAAKFISSFDVSKKDIRKDTLFLPKYRAMYLEKLINENQKIIVDADAEFTQLTNDFNGIRDIEYDIPAELINVLRPYQKAGYKWLKMLASYEFGGILADDMGLGKTLQVITLLLSEPEEPLPSLVVAPTSLMYNWEHEIKKFAPVLKAIVLSGSPAKRQELLEASTDANVFITTYDLLKRDIEIYENKSFKYIIADEAQYIKNPGTQNAISVKTVKSKARFALTGTPIENSLSELWSIFDFILPDYLHNATKFAKLYETPIVKQEDMERAAQLQRQISPFIMRRLKKDVLTELPDKVETTLYAEMHPEQRKIYLANLLVAKGTLDDAVESGEFMKNKLQILAQITRLRQASCHPALFVEDYKGGSGKLDLTIETIRSATDSGHRILIFSQFTSMLAILREKITECGIDYFYLDGSVESDKRQQMAGMFNAGERQLFLISLRAGGTGLNLTGADIVIHYDQWWNPAVMNQAADRAHRIGQDKVVQVINIVSKDSIEEKILELQTKKKDLVDSVLKTGENFISQMSIDEIRALFSVD